MCLWLGICSMHLREGRYWISRVCPVWLACPARDARASTAASRRASSRRECSRESSVARQSSASTVPLVMTLFVREPATHGNRPLLVDTTPSRDRAAVGRFGLATLARVLRNSTLDRMELDHVLIGVTDLAAAARELEARCGLVSVEGGSHPHWGTANRIVPLGNELCGARRGGRRSNGGR
jgi:hypothetical protein